MELEVIHMDLNTKPVKKSQESRQSNRRTPSIKALLFYLYKGKRGQARRQLDASKPFYIDVYEPWVGLIIGVITCLSILDSFLTLQIIERGGIEVNPLMITLLEINDTAFIFGKIAITSTCLVFLLIHIKFKVLRLFSMSTFLISTACFYALLIAYELTLLSSI